MQDVKTQLLAEQVAPELLSVIDSILAAAKTIAGQVARGSLAGVLGATENENVQGETQKKLDVIANDILKQALCSNANVCAIASEEEDTSVVAHTQGRYLVAFDPLDGSSNIDINGQIGTIFSVLPAQAQLAAGDEAQFFQPGSQQVCAGYILYGAACLLVLTTGKTALCFTLEPATQEFVLTQDALRIPAATQEFAINMANQRFWSANVNRYIAELLQGETGVRGKRFNMRWNAAMVGDVHRVLMRGGIFLYPSDSRNAQQSAKLRLLYEANPMALLIAAAGGKAMTESGAILSVQPDSLHQRVPVILGSADEVACCVTHLANSL